MAFDSLAALQRMRQMEQQAAINGKKIVLKRMNDKLDIWLFVLWFVLLIPTLGISFVLLFVYLFRYFFSKEIYVQDIATYDKFYITRDDWTKYKVNKKMNKKETRKLDV
ncbi:hypothetical protein G6R42_000771 [Listeria monocytogenes]|uniref:Uncharacterized protein n=1 Tax=Listeria monocytogenes TaxID=1639 RepID=A0AB37NEL2_LISMN|nr:hypothetical protein [Listeria monocytogenes]EGX6704322.1 hypothetical protein [Listeria innocua]MCZ19018.1 hypothetical protein [Listeria monocytogenes serotype 4b]EAC2258069.1 hypothetical protein [Listeria monocytogenes]EAC4060447.1 hypothetical protein [Listeria monocytogenes]EAC6217664.1 hypothetical protein [Listeria monocytogenes]